MKRRRLVALSLVAGAVGFAWPTLAQTPLPTGLAEAIAAGDTVTITAIVAANQNNPAVLTQIANALMTAAGSATGTSPTTAALFAAIALSTGTLSGNDAVRALNMVSSSPAALALLTNPNAPSTGGTFTANTANTPPPTNLASNPSQSDRASGSSN